MLRNDAKSDKSKDGFTLSILSWMRFDIIFVVIKIEMFRMSYKNAIKSKNIKIQPQK